MGRNLLSTPYISTTIASQAILRGGSEQQKAKWLPLVAEGSIRHLSPAGQRGLGRHPPAVQLSRRYELQGTKLLVNDAAVADFFIVSANHNGAQVLVLVEAAQLARMP